MSSSNQTIEHLEHVLESNYFKNSAVNRKLLDYLVRQSLNGNIPHEIDIAMDIFGKDSKYNPADDSLVRSHIYGLRQKLEKYYLTEGREDDLRFILPKGRYQVQVKNNRTVPERTTPVSRLLATVVVLMFVGLVVLSFYTLRLRSYKAQVMELSVISPDNPVWNPLIESDYPVLLVVGDYFVFWEERTSKGSDRKVRDGAINSQAELEKYFEQHPEKAEKFTGMTGSYITPGMNDNLATLYPFLTANGIPAGITSSIQLQASETQSNNILFVGPYKTLYGLNHYIDQLTLRFQIYPHRILYEESSNEVDFGYLNVELPDQSLFVKDFVLFARLPGPEQNLIYILGSFTPSSVESTLRHTLAPEFLNEVAALQNSPEADIPTYFEALFEITGWGGNRTVKLGQFFEVDPKGISHP